MAIIGAGVTLRGQTQPESRYTFVLDAAIVVGDIGKAVSIKAGSANTVKLAAAGELVVGRLYSFEDRTVEGIKVGTVETRGGFVMTTTGVVAVGDSVVGDAIVGTVKAGADSRNRIVEILTGTTAVVLFL
jgi:hypothetical protein